MKIKCRTSSSKIKFLSEVTDRNVNANFSTNATNACNVKDP